MLLLRTVAAWHVRGWARLRLHADELQAELAHSVEESVKVRLVFDFAYEGGCGLARLEGHAVERRLQALRQPAAYRNPVHGRLHVSSVLSVIPCWIDTSGLVIVRESVSPG